MRKERVQDTWYGLSPVAVAMQQREEGLTFSKPPLMSRKTVETFLLSIGRVLISCVRVVQASSTDKPGREPYWCGLRWPLSRATQERRPFIILLSIFESVWGRTLTPREDGEW